MKKKRLDKKTEKCDKEFVFWYALPPEEFDRIARRDGQLTLAERKFHKI